MCLMGTLMYAMVCTNIAGFFVGFFLIQEKKIGYQLNEFLGISQLLPECVCALEMANQC